MFVIKYFRFLFFFVKLQPIPEESYPPLFQHPLSKLKSSQAPKFGGRFNPLAERERGREGGVHNDDDIKHSTTKCFVGYNIHESIMDLQRLITNCLWEGVVYSVQLSICLSINLKLILKNICALVSKT